MALLIQTSLIFIFTFCICLNVYPQTPAHLYEEQEILKSELQLAKTKNIYFVFDLRDKQVLIKSRGITLKEMRIDDLRLWGRPVEPFIYILLKKDTLAKPKREKIEPKKEQKDEKFEIKALELDDMPKRYRLTLSPINQPDERIAITVRGTSSGKVSIISKSLSLAVWYMSRPLFTLWYHIRGKPFTALYLTLQEEDSRSIYWSFTEGAECIIYNPGG